MSDFPFPGELRSRYEPRRELGRGGMGVVLLAHDRELDREVVVKLSLDGGDPELAARAAREAQVLATLEHPNVLRVFDAGRTDQGPYLVTEHLVGRSLDELTGDVALGPVFRQLAEGLRAVHAQGLLHRDLKPANMFLEDSGRALLIDFGLVRDPRRTNLTRTGQVLGTMAYMAPECLRGQPATTASDWYGWAAAYYACLEGRPPYGAPAMLMHATEGAPLELHFDRTPAETRPPLLELLDPDPAARPDSPSTSLWTLGPPDTAAAPRSPANSAATTVVRKRPSAPSPVPATPVPAPSDPPPGERHARPRPATSRYGGLLLLGLIGVLGGLVVLWARDRIDWIRAGGTTSLEPASPAQELLESWARRGRGQLLRELAPETAQQQPTFGSTWPSTTSGRRDDLEDFAARLADELDGSLLPNWLEERDDLWRALREVPIEPARRRSVLRALSHLEVADDLLRRTGHSLRFDPSSLRQLLISGGVGHMPSVTPPLVRLSQQPKSARRKHTDELRVPIQGGPCSASVELVAKVGQERLDAIAPVIEVGELCLPILGGMISGDLWWTATIPPWAHGGTELEEVVLRLGLLADEDWDRRGYRVPPTIDLDASHPMVAVYALEARCGPAPTPSTP